VGEEMAKEGMVFPKDCNGIGKEKNFTFGNSLDLEGSE